MIEYQTANMCITALSVTKCLFLWRKCQDIEATESRMLELNNAIPSESQSTPGHRQLRSQTAIKTQ